MGYRENFFDDTPGNYGWFYCEHCHRPLRRGEVCVDHIVPQSRGGWDRPDNLQAMCRHCNSSKGAQMNRTLPDYLRNNKNRAIRKLWDLFG